MEPAESRQEEGMRNYALPLRLVAARRIFGRLDDHLQEALPELLARGLIRARCQHCGVASTSWREDDVSGGLTIWPSRRLCSWLGRVGIDARAIIVELVRANLIWVECRLCAAREERGKGYGR